MQTNPVLQSDQAPHRSHRIRWSITVTVLFIGNVLLWADRTNFSVAAAVWKTQFHWSPATVGLMLSTFSFGYMLLQPLGGYLSDRLGTKKMIPISVGGWSLFTFLTPIAPGLVGLTGMFRAMLGAFEAPFNSAITTTVAKGVPDPAKRGIYNSFLQSGSKLGPAIGTSVAGVLAQFLGASSIFWVFGGFGIVISIGWWLYSRRKSEYMASTDTIPGESDARSEVPSYSLAKLLSNSTIWGLMIAYFSIPYCTFLFLTWLPIYLSTYRHFQLVATGFLSALPYLAAFVSYLFAGWMSDKMISWNWTKDGLHRKLPIYVGTLIYVVSLPVAATTSSNAEAVGMIVLANVGLAFATTQYWVMVTDITPRQAGTVAGFMNFFGILGGTLAPSITGLIVSSTGSFVVPFIVSVGLMILAALIVAVFVRVKPLNQLISLK